MLACLLVLSSVRRLAFGSGERMDFGTLFGYFGLGVGGGFILYVIFSLLGYSIGKAIKLTKM